MALGIGASALFSASGVLAYTVQNDAVDVERGSIGVVIDVLANDLAGPGDDTTCQLLLVGGEGSVSTGLGIATINDGGTPIISDDHIVYDNGGLAGSDSFAYEIDGIGCAAAGPATVSVTVVDAPVATILPASGTIPDSDGLPGEVVSFDGSTSSDLDGISSYLWEVFEAVDAPPTQTFSVPNPDIPLPDGTTSVVLTVTDSLGNTGSSEVEIVVAAPPAASIGFEVAEVSFTEGSGTVSISVTRFGGAGGSVSVDFATAAATALADVDFVPVAGTLVWADGDGDDKIIELQLIDDQTFENPQQETLTLVLSAPGGGASLAAQSELAVEITDDDLRAGGAGIAGPDQVVRVTGETEVGTFNLEATQSESFISYQWSLAGEIVGNGPTLAQAGPPGEYTYTLTVLNSDEVELTDAVNVTVTRELVQAAPLLQEIDGLDDTERAVAVILDTICARLNTAATLTPDQEDLRERCSQIILNDDTGEIVEALGALSGRQITGQMTNTLEIGSLQFRNVAGRMRALRRGTSAVSVAGLNLNVQGKNIPAWVLESGLKELLGGNAGSGDQFGRWAFFVNGNLSFGEQDETGRETGFEFSSGGLTAGADYRASDNLFVGIAVGYGKGDTDFDNDGGSLDSEGWSTSLYGSWANDRLYLDGLLGYGWSDHDSKRTIRYEDAAGTVNRAATGSTDGSQWSIGVESGLSFHRQAWMFNPNISAFYTEAGIDGFDEDGAGGLNLRYEDQDAESLTVSGGAALSYTITTTRMVLIPQLRLDYVLELENGEQIINVRFANDPFANDPSLPSPLIPVATDEPDDRYVTFGASVSAQFVNGISGFVDWQTVMGYENLTVDSISFGLRWERLF